MIATEYILTFIPIDEINGNAKIGRYVEKEILSRKWTNKFSSNDNIFMFFYLIILYIPIILIVYSYTYI